MSGQLMPWTTKADRLRQAEAEVETFRREATAAQQTTVEAFNRLRRAEARLAQVHSSAG